MAQDPTTSPTPVTTGPKLISSKTYENGDRLEVYENEKRVVYGDGRPPRVEPLHRQNRTADQLDNIAGDKTARLPQQDFGQFGRQHQESENAVFNAKPGQQFDWQDFKQRHGEYIDANYTGHFDQFVKDVQDKKLSPTTTSWFQNAANANNKAQGKKPYFSPLNPNNPDPNQLDSKFGNITYSVPSFGKPVAPLPTPPVAKTPETAAETPPDPARPADTRWWQQDVVNMAAAATDRVNKYNPMLQQVQYETPDYALLDPTRQLAAIKEDAARFQDLAQNTSSGSVARANVLGSSGESAKQVADVLGTYENQNVGISNAASSAQAQIHNQQTDRNTEYLNKFIGETATVNQQYDNAMQAKKYRMTDAYNQGTTNAMHQTQLEQVLPQVHVDRTNGVLEFSGNGKSLQYDDAPATGTATASTNLAQQGALYREGLKQAQAMNLDPDDAQKYAQAQVTQALKPAPVNNTRLGQAKQMLQAGTGTRKFHFGGEVLPALPDVGC